MDINQLNEIKEYYLHYGVLPQSYAEALIEHAENTLANEEWISGPVAMDAEWKTESHAVSIEAMKAVKTRQKAK